MNNFQFTETGQGILKDYYGDGSASKVLSEALKRRSVKLNEAIKDNTTTKG